jgi:hypothetical protein
MQRVLRKNPYDIETLFKLATLLGELRQPELDQKRKLLHRILYLEPTHKPARQMLFEMDRVAIGGDVSRLSAAVILPNSPSSDHPELPLILRYSIVHQFLVYIFILGTLFAALGFARGPELLALVSGFLVSLLVPLWYVSVVIEVDNTGLNASYLFGLVQTEIAWSEVSECKLHPLGQGLKLITRDRKLVEVSAQVYGYAFILDILRQMRPDLFDIPAVPRTASLLRNPSAITSLAARTLK